MKYRMKIKEIDENTDYPLSVLSGMTGLGRETIERLHQEGKFPIRQKQNGEAVVNGKEFLDWARSVEGEIEVEKTDYPTMEVPDK